MRQRVDLARINRQALQRVPTAIDGVPAGLEPDLSGMTLDEWFDVD